MNAYALALINQSTVRSHSEGRAPARTLRTCAVEKEFHAPAAESPWVDEKNQSETTPGGYSRITARSVVAAYLPTAPGQFTQEDVLHAAVKNGYAGCAESIRHNLSKWVTKGVLTATGGHGRSARIYRLIKL